MGAQFGGRWTELRRIAYVEEVGFEFGIKASVGDCKTRLCRKGGYGRCRQRQETERNRQVIPYVRSSVTEGAVVGFLSGCAG